MTGTSRSVREVELDRGDDAKPLLELSFLHHAGRGIAGLNLEYTLTRPPIGVSDSNGDLDLTPPPAGIDQVISIIGAGAATTIIDANQIDRIFRIEQARTAVLTGLTLRNGFTTSAGNIYNGGSLTVNQSIISGNRAEFDGGGIYNAGSLTVNQSTISDNQTMLTGGGIYNISSLTVSQSTISGNQGNFGGGLFNRGSLIVSNSTISQNSANINYLPLIMR